MRLIHAFGKHEINFLVLTLPCVLMIDTKDVVMGKYTVTTSHFYDTTTKLLLYP